jgi:hypothetical protein
MEYTKLRQVTNMYIANTANIVMIPVIAWTFLENRVINISTSTCFRIAAHQAKAGRATTTIIASVISVPPGIGDLKK